MFLDSWRPGDQNYRVTYPEWSPIFRRCSMYWTVDCSQIYHPFLDSWSPGDQNYRVTYPERSPIFERCCMYWTVDCSQIYHMCFWVPEDLGIRTTELPTLSDLLYSGDAVCIGRLIVVRSTTCVSGFLKSWGSELQSYLPWVISYILEMQYVLDGWW